MPLIDRDQEHLRLLAIGYYLMAAMTAFFSLFGVFYIFIGLLIPSLPQTNVKGDFSPAIMGYIFAGLGVLFTVLGGTVSACTYLTGRYLMGRRKRVFCLIVAGIQCFYVPFGTALGVCTFLVLQRPEVQAQFIRQSPEQVTPQSA